jgi:hypothetical protein
LSLFPPPPHHLFPSLSVSVYAPPPSLPHYHTATLLFVTPYHRTHARTHVCTQPPPAGRLDERERAQAALALDDVITRATRPRLRAPPTRGC